MVRRALISATLLFAIAGDLFAQVLVSSGPASSRLSRVSIFAIGGVGFAGATSAGEKDFRVLMIDPQAEQAFEDLYVHGNNQAKAYALLGLHTLRPQRFHEIYDKLSTTGEEVSVMQGCIASKRKLKTIAQEIDGGSFVVKPEAHSGQRSN